MLGLVLVAFFPFETAGTTTWTAESNQASAWFGESVAAAGDVNADGYSDVIVGARSYDNGQMDEGRAFVYLGSASGLSTSPAWTAESDQESAFFGESVAAAGDVNGDGYSDVIVGAFLYDNFQTDEGRAYVYPGSPWEDCTASSGRVSGFQVLANKTDLHWEPSEGAVSYDVVKGDLIMLHNTGGNFTSSLLECLESGSSDTFTSDTSVPSPGGGYYYLVRYQDSCNDYSTYDSGSPPQQGSRDAEIDASGVSCEPLQCLGEDPSTGHCNLNEQCFPGFCDHSGCTPSRCYCAQSGQWICSMDCLGHCEN